jgi:hypothetical protein
VFGVEVTPKGSTQTRTFRVAADYPDSIVSITPTSSRFDIGGLMQSKDGASDVLLCAPASTK